MSSFRLIEKIHQQAPQQAMIVISAYEDEIFQQELAVQELNYLIKPVSLEDLLNVLIPVCQSLPLEHQGYCSSEQLDAKTIKIRLKFIS